MLKNILSCKECVSIIGLGYVGLPLAVAFAEKGIKVIGFDINEKKINFYKNGVDITNEIGNDRLKKQKHIEFTNNAKKLENAIFHIIAVPTPVLKNKIPNLEPIKNASRLLGNHLKRGSIVVYESTVYPGVTEEICMPILENESKLVCGKDFKIGYSPERINPGDKEHRLENIVKIVSAMDEDSLEVVSDVYSQIIKAGVYKAKSIKIAEAAKVIENSQRDINIAFINELSLIFNKMNIDTKEVLEAAGTKWNFLHFSPGLVGGHCIGVDPYYLAFKAEELGYHAQVILAGRRINDSMGKVVAENTVKKLIKNGKQVKGSIILVMGLTFKENCPDLRNSKVIDIIDELKEYGINVIVNDPIADDNEALIEYGIELHRLENIKDVDGIIIAVEHNNYKNIAFNEIKSLYNEKKKPFVLIDVKGILDKEKAEKEFEYWRL